MSSSTIVMFASGHFEPSSFVDMGSDARYVAVDGGLNHCHSLRIRPHLIIGDFDSVNKSLMGQYASVEKIQLNRNKPLTDLEAALRLEKVDAVAQTIIHGALGKRIDHSLTNLLILLSHPGRVKMLSATETVTAVGPGDGGVTFQFIPDQTLSLISFGGPVTSVELITEDNTTVILLLDRSDSPYVVPHWSSTLHIKSGSGVLLAIMSKGGSPINWGTYVNPSPLPFTFPARMVDHITLFRHLISLEGERRVESSEEVLSVIDKDMSVWTYLSKIGQTISLIPVFGPVSGIKTEGLKFQPQEGVLHMNYVGISNVAVANRVKVEVESGTLLCIVNKSLIDNEMLSL